LKHKARVLSREADIPLHDALDRIAAQEGFSSWSLLAAKLSAEGPAAKLFTQLRPGDIVLVGARPGQGKTKIGLEVLIEAAKAGYRGAFFTLEYTEKESLELMRTIIGGTQRPEGIEIDGSDAISADHVQSRLAAAPRGTVAVIDYLQLLDQKRTKPPLMEQVLALKAFAGERELILVFLSQIDRSFDQKERSCPGADDVRLPNPLELSLFDRMYFLHKGEMRFRQPAET
jgi:replicative DNA helicase